MCLPNCDPLHVLCIIYSPRLFLTYFGSHKIWTYFDLLDRFICNSTLTFLWHSQSRRNLRQSFASYLSQPLLLLPPPAWHRALEFSSELVYVNNRNKNLTWPSTCRPIFTVLASHRFTFTAEAIFWLPFKFFPLLVVCDVYKHSRAQEAPVCRCIKQSIKLPYLNSLVLVL